MDYLTATEIVQDMKTLRKLEEAMEKASRQEVSIPGDLFDQAHALYEKIGNYHNNDEIIVAFLAYYNISEEGVELLISKMDLLRKGDLQGVVKSHLELLAELEDLHNNGYLQTYMLELILEEGRISA